ncbi:sialate O-acetylesterase [Mucilaginibacter calamicampi]|uniref:Sialate O-acetylesterase n=1 Tax=Mucilaginibacter calamicampi TaxID=1302352 RepID=A0ABW2YX30_9SPHI
MSAIFFPAYKPVEKIKQDKNFYIFLNFGQSNMEGNGRVRPEDTVGVDPRFQVFETVNCPNLGREKGKWYKAKPPLCRCNTAVSPSDYFGRTLLANLPSNIRVGIVNVAVAGAKIEVFDTTSYKGYIANQAGWMKNIVKEYNDNPYQYLVDAAKEASKYGVIKGILLHQGESNANDSLWTTKVKGIYNSMLHDLDLKAKNTPLLVGELVNADQKGACAGFNKFIATIPQVIPNSYVISSAGAPAKADRLHFTFDGYKLLGTRYGEKMLELLGKKGPYLAAN